MSRASSTMWSPPARSLVVANHNEFVIERSPDLGIMISDATKLRQSVLNLLSNAGKFTKDGRVSLNVCARAGHHRRLDPHLHRRQRHRHHRGQRSEAVQGLQSGRSLDLDEIWRHRSGTGAEPKPLPHDGRGDYRGKHLRARVTVHNTRSGLYRGRGSFPAKAHGSRRRKAGVACRIAHPWTRRAC